MPHEVGETPWGTWVALGAMRAARLLWGWGVSEGATTTTGTLWGCVTPIVQVRLVGGVGGALGGGVGAACLTPICVFGV